MIADPLREARFAVDSGKFREAIDYLEAMRMQDRRNPEWKLLASMANWRLGRYSTSRTAAEEARQRYRSWADADGEMRALNVSAAGAFAMGRLDQAETGFLEAGAIAQRLDDELMAARCANNLGNVYFYRGEDDTALSYYRRAAVRFERVPFARGVIECLHNMAIVLRSLGELGDSRAAAARAVELAREWGERRLEAQALANQSETLLELGELKLASVMTERALAQAKSEEDLLTELDCLRMKSRLAALDHRIDDAIDLAEQSHRIAVSVNHPWMMGTTADQLAQVLDSGGDSDGAAEARAVAAENFASIGAESRLRGVE